MYDMELVPKRHMSIQDKMHPSRILCSDSEMQTLTEAWMSHNKSRVYAKQTPKCLEHTQQSPCKETDTSLPVHIAPASTAQPTTASPYVLASLRKVVSSRSDLPSVGAQIQLPSPKSVTTSAAAAGTNPLTSYHNSQKMRVSEKTHATEMAAIEHQLIMKTLDSQLRTYVVPSDKAGLVHGLSTGSKDPVAHECRAYITTTDQNGVLIQPTSKTYLPIAPPSQEQIKEAGENTNYKNNVLQNIADALDGQGIHVVMHSGGGITHRVTHSAHDTGTVFLDKNVSLQALGTTSCCEALLFGENRKTSTCNFTLFDEIVVTYAAAVRQYQRYSNVRVNKQIMLVPSFFKRAPLIISMSCPELGLRDVVTRFTRGVNHPKFGSHHPTQVVEVMAELVPFVKQCCHSHMSRRHKIHSDKIPSSSTLDHCFAHDAEHGVSAYVGIHGFTLPVGIMDMDENLIVYVAALFGGTTTLSKCE